VPDHRVLEIVTAGIDKSTTEQVSGGMATLSATAVHGLSLARVKAFAGELKDR
jgi:hypothetical protein